LRSGSDTRLPRLLRVNSYDRAVHLRGTEHPVGLAGTDVAGWDRRHDGETVTQVSAAGERMAIDTQGSGPWRLWDEIEAAYAR